MQSRLQESFSIKIRQKQKKITRRKKKYRFGLREKIGLIDETGKKAFLLKEKKKICDVKIAIIKYLLEKRKKKVWQERNFRQDKKSSRGYREIVDDDESEDSMCVCNKRFCAIIRDIVNT